MGKCARLAWGIAVVLGSLSIACSRDDNEDAAANTGGTGGTGGAGGTGGTGGTAPDRCDALSLDVLTSCQELLESCPATLDDFLEDATANGSLGGYVVLEGDGLRQATDFPSLAGVGYSFADDGTLAGWHAWNDVPWGPCASELQSLYERGRLLDTSPTAEGVHRCDMALDALESGVLCDCPCPDPAPSNGVVEGSEACLSIDTYPTCAKTFEEQTQAASLFEGTMRSGCGVRTITIETLDCAYDETGGFVGGERRRGDFPRDECPGVDAYRAGELPESCVEETTCTFASSPAVGETPCPLSE